jgi:hypothetical protein
MVLSPEQPMNYLDNVSLLPLILSPPFLPKNLCLGYTLKAVSYKCRISTRQNMSQCPKRIVVSVVLGR